MSPNTPFDPFFDDDRGDLAVFSDRPSAQAALDEIEAAGGHGVIIGSVEFGGFAIEATPTDWNDPARGILRTDGTVR